MLQTHRPTSLQLALAGGLLLGLSGAAAYPADPAKVLLGQLNQSDAIVVGRAIERRNESIDGEDVSLVKLKIEKKIRGTVAPEIEIVIPRTLVHPGAILLETGDPRQPVIASGDEVLLFLTRYPGRDSSYSITSGDMGKYSVTTNAEGEQRSDRYLMAAQAKGGVPLSSLIQQIRLELKIPDEKPENAPKPQ